MKRDRFTSLVVGGALLLTVAAAFATEDVTAKLARFVVEHARSHVVDCPEPVRDRQPERQVLCADYAARWSSFKSDWDFIMDRFDRPVPATPTSAWTRRDGRFERDYRVGKSDVTVVFDEAEGLLVFAYTLEGTDDPSDAPTALGGDASRTKVRLAGFGGVTTPRLIESSKVEPVYPDAAAEQGIEGSVGLETVIRADGTVGDLKLLYERPEGLGFGETAMAAVRQWRYEPARYEGEPVDARFTVYVTFEPRP